MRLRCAKNGVSTCFACRGRSSRPSLSLERAKVGHGAAIGPAVGCLAALRIGGGTADLAQRMAFGLGALVVLLAPLEVGSRPGASLHSDLSITGMKGMKPRCLTSLADGIAGFGDAMRSPTRDPPYGRHWHCRHARVGDQRLAPRQGADHSGGACSRTTRRRRRRAHWSSSTGTRSSAQGATRCRAASARRAGSRDPGLARRRPSSSATRADLRTEIAALVLAISLALFGKPVARLHLDDPDGKRQVRHRARTRRMLADPSASPSQRTYDKQGTVLDLRSLPRGAARR